MKINRHLKALSLVAAILIGLSSVVLLVYYDPIVSSAAVMVLVLVALVGTIIAAAYSLVGR